MLYHYLRRFQFQRSLNSKQDGGQSSRSRCAQGTRSNVSSRVQGNRTHQHFARLRHESLHEQTSRCEVRAETSRSWCVVIVWVTGSCDLIPRLVSRSGWEHCGEANVRGWSGAVSLVWWECCAGGQEDCAHDNDHAHPQVRDIFLRYPTSQLIPEAT